MTHYRKLVRAQITALGDREVEIVMSTAALARDGHVLLPGGCHLDNYRANPIALWSHDPDKPIGNVENIVVGPDQISARAVFAPEGISHKADEICGLTKAGVIRAVSVGFDPIDMEPLDPKKPRGGQRIAAWDLLELSFVSLGADVAALVTARQHRGANGEETMVEWKVGAKRGLPIEDNDAWDGDAAEASIFEWAGGDDFDPAKARQGFLVYDADKPKERGSYKLPIAHAVDGELKVPKGAIRAAASRLPDTDIPDDVKKDAGEALDAYKTEAGIGDEKRGGRKSMKRVKAVRRTGKVTFKRGLYDVANLCYLFESLGWAVDCAKWEAAVEGDDSKVPAMLAAALAELGDALLAMTTEEIAEALAGRDVEPGDDDDDEVLLVEERANIAAATTPAVRAFRRGLAHAKLRSGKTLSAETVRCLRDASAMHEEAIALHRSAIGKHKDAMGAVDDMMDRAGVSDETVETTQTVQTSSGTDVSDGSNNGRAAPMSADFRRRQADLLGLAVH